MSESEIELSDEEQAERIAEEEGVSIYFALVDRLGWSVDEIRERYLKPGDQSPDPVLLDFLGDTVGCTDDELGMTPDGEFEDS